MRFIHSRPRQLLPVGGGRGLPQATWARAISRWVVPGILALTWALPAPARAAQEPPPAPARLSVEVFNLGGGARIYLRPTMAATVLLDSKQEGNERASYVQAGLVLISTRDFYEWQLYAAAGASYRLSRDPSAGSSALRPFVGIGGQFEIFFLEYQVAWDTQGWEGQGNFRYGVRIHL
ncbi:hypothetical protein U7230_10160 [Carboxydochorda subterranea]|uniref:Outer membrane protein beta-barrel domain-containing protein n=1 Tax=Carboxydichorda subterranea TaxID=3109565 RepID=A0ABZ1BVD8_9FIRM|nr:hypothetical protein [Limnochorda sp. L945t]WRP16460.1 hypothetical protein U7230_10160 [Limnochorda sp. L945t]